MIYISSVEVYLQSSRSFAALCQFKTLFHQRKLRYCQPEPNLSGNIYEKYKTAPPNVLNEIFLHHDTHIAMIRSSLEHFFHVLTFLYGVENWIYLSNVKHLRVSLCPVKSIASLSLIFSTFKITFFRLQRTKSRHYRVQGTIFNIALPIFQMLLCWKEIKNMITFFFRSNVL